MRPPRTVAHTNLWLGNQTHTLARSLPFALNSNFRRKTPGSAPGASWDQTLTLKLTVTRTLKGIPTLSPTYPYTCASPLHEISLQPWKEIRRAESLWPWQRSWTQTKPLLRLSPNEDLIQKPENTTHTGLTNSTKIRGMERGISP